MDEEAGRVSVTIREARLSDAAGLARVHVDSWRATYAGIVPAEFLAGLSYEKSESRWQAALAGDGTFHCFYVAEASAEGQGALAGQIAGFATGRCADAEGLPYQGEVGAIYIAEAHHRQGIGRRLVAAVAARLLQEGMPAMMIWALTENKGARAFYEALGGVLVAERTVTIGGAELPEVAYGWADVRTLCGSKAS